MRKIFIKLLNLIVSSFIFASVAFSANLTIHNDNNKPITVVVKPESNLTDINLPFKEIKIAANATEYITITSDDFTKGSKTYSYFMVKGSTTAQVINESCRNLALTNNYHISFNKGTAGSICVVKNDIDLKQ